MKLSILLLNYRLRQLYSSNTQLHTNSMQLHNDARQLIVVIGKFTIEVYNVPEVVGNFSNFTAFVGNFTPKV
jgi:hypothetical protein